MKGRRLVTRRRLWVEELEGRVVPSVLSTSTNWSGYAIKSGLGAVTSVAGTWQVPSVTGTLNGHVATWVGIDGWSSPTVEQVGTEVEVIAGRATYYAWYEMYPSASITITSLTVKAGDTISAQVSYAAGKYTLQLTNTSQKNASFTITQTAPSLQRSSAEWIVEAPSGGAGILPLANFGTQTFSGAKTTINGTTGAIDNAKWANGVEQINMTDQFGHTLDKTSALTNTGTPATSKFTVTFTGSTVSTPPTTHPQGTGSVGLGWGWGWSWWWFTPRQTGTMPAQQAALASILYGSTVQSPVPSGNLAAPATLPAPSVAISSAPSSFVPPGPSIVGSGGNANLADGGRVQQPAMPPALPDDNDPATPGLPQTPDAAPDGVPMPPADSGEARGEVPGRGVAPDWASDALFTDGHWAPAVPGDGAQALHDQPPAESSTVESVSGVLFALSLGAYWRFTTEESAERRRRQGWR
jgi:hypothetical protein